MALQPGLCRTWSEALKTGFLTTRFIWSMAYFHCKRVLCRLFSCTEECTFGRCRVHLNWTNPGKKFNVEVDSSMYVGVISKPLDMVLLLGYVFRANEQIRSYGDGT